MKKHKAPIYLDHAAGTPLSKSVLKSMQSYLTEKFHNPGSLYQAGVDVAHDILDARNTIAGLLGVRSQEITITDGGTESNNLAIRGVIKAYCRAHPTRTPHVITSAIEHASVLETCYDLEKNNVITLSVIPVNEVGYIDHAEFKKALSDDTVLVSIGYANGEIGVIQDIKKIAKTIRHHKKHRGLQYPYFHTDAVQVFNYFAVKPLSLGVDLLTLNASKIYGPKKVALLYKKPLIQMDAIITGGNQESGLRSGTENTAYIIGFAAALEEASIQREKELQRLGDIRSYLISQIAEYDKNIVINGVSEALTLPNIVNISIPELSHEEVLIRLDAQGFMCSVKSACKSGEDGDSHVIKALRTGNTGSLRISLGRSTDLKSIRMFTKTLFGIIDEMKDVHQKYYL